MKSLFIAKLWTLQQNSGFFNKFVTFSNKIVDSFDQLVAFRGAFLQNCGPFYLKGGTFAPRAPS